MRKSTLVCGVLYLLVLCRNSIVLGQDRWSPADGPGMVQGGYSNPGRGFFGLPTPQQWPGMRPAGVQRYGQYQGYTGAGTNCPNGQCGNGSIAAGGCAGGQCSTGACSNGQCSSGYGMNSRCPGGVCPQGMSSNWMPRTSQSGLADPFRGTASRDDQWTTTRRPVYSSAQDNWQPLNTNRDNFDLRSDYFGPNDRDNLAPVSNWQPRNSMPASRSRSNYRSLEAPADHAPGSSRI